MDQSYEVFVKLSVAPTIETSPAYIFKSSMLLYYVVESEEVDPFAAPDRFFWYSDASLQ